MPRQQTTTPRFVSIDRLTPDPENANLGTARGEALIAESIATLGLGRSIVADRNNTIIAGNKTLEAAAAAGIDKVLVIPTTGDTLIVVQRMDLDLRNDRRARLMATLDNRTNELNLEWDAGVIKSQNDRFNFTTQETGISALELRQMEAAAREREADPQETESEPAATFGLLVMCKTASDQQRLKQRLESEGFDARLI